MLQQINEIFSGLSQDENGVWECSFENTSQEREILLRENVAAKGYNDYLGEVSNHHSVEVMDYEVRRALHKVPKNGIIIDVGGCWGWHWRNMHKQRPDVHVVIVELVKSNFRHTQSILGSNICNTIHLVHGNATELPFPENSFDMYWSVQTLQHIPEFKKSIEEAKRILREGGIFLNYSLNHEKTIELLYKSLGKDYVTKGEWGELYLARASDVQVSQIEQVFVNLVIRRYTEVFFHPELRFKSGREGSLLGKIDALIGSSNVLLSWIARQQSYETTKLTNAD